MWLGALPVPTLDTKLDNEDSPLGVPIEYTSCVCGTNVDVFGTHGLSCSGCRILLHADVNKTICHALVSGVYLWVCAVMMVRGLLA